MDVAGVGQSGIGGGEQGVDGVAVGHVRAVLAAGQGGDPAVPRRVTSTPAAAAGAVRPTVAELAAPLP